MVVTEICLDSYLRSLVSAYQQWWRLYTLTDATGRESQRVERDLIAPAFFDFGLMVQTVESPKAEQERELDGDREKKEKIERLPVLEGICKYAAEHVLLVGRPGSGKSTALARLLLQEAENALSDRNAKIPVLVELRYLPSEANESSVCDCIIAFMHKHDPALNIDEAEIKHLLRQGRLLLFVDGVNELPSDRGRAQVNQFRELFQKTCPMIFTTRELSAGGDLGIAKRLEMQPLTEPQMQQFVMAYLPTQGERLLRQLSGRLREFGQTPLLLWMLCEVFKSGEKLPENLGKVFQIFTQTYENSSVRNHEVSVFKNNVQPLSDRRIWKDALKHLASKMMQGNSPIDFRTVISKDEIIQEFKLLFKDEPQPPKLARDCLDDLLNYHLIQIRNEDKVEFRHQLIQEYYAAEWLLGLLPNLSDARLQQGYLNYLKWTEPLALMLELVEGEEQAVRVVRLALEVDLRLGARLAGAVKYGFQEKTVGLLVDQHLPLSTVSHLLGLTRSEKAIPYLKNQITLIDSSISTQAIKALGKVPTQTALDTLIKILDDFENNELIHGEIALALGEIRTPSAVSFLEDWNIRKVSEGDEMSYLKIRIEIALWEVHGDSRKPIMFQQISPDYNEQDFEREHGEINLDNVIKFMESEPVYYSNSEDFIKNSLAKFKDEDVISRLAKIVSTGRYNAKMLALEILCSREGKNTENIFKEALGDEISFVREVAISGLAKIGSESIIPLLVKLLVCDKDRTVRDTAIRAFGKIGGDGCFKMLTELFKENQTNSYSLGTIAKALGDIGRKESIDLLISKLNKEDEALSADIIEALGSIGGDKAITTLIQLLNDEELDISDKVAKALTNLVHSDRNLPTLTQQLPHLLTLIPTEASQQALSVITTIQARCKYYNYEIYNTPLQETEDYANSVEKILQEIHQTLKTMSETGKYNINSEVVQIVEKNYGQVIGKNSGQVVGKNYANDPALLQTINEITQVLANLQKAHPTATEAEAKDIIEAEFKEIQNNQPNRWTTFRQQLLNPERWLNGGKATISEIAKHYAENSVFLKAGVAFLDGFSADEE
jgi:HEAT repeat protein